MDDRDDIIVIQEKSKKAFRKKVKELIDKYRKELGLDFSINLTFMTKTNKLRDWHVDLHGIVFTGYISLLAATQFFPDETVDKIIHCGVYSIAREYEQMCGQISGFTWGEVDILTGETISETHHPGTGPKYRLPLSESEEEKIISDYRTAEKHIIQSLKDKQMGCA